MTGQSSRFVDLGDFRINPRLDFGSAPPGQRGHGKRLVTPPSLDIPAAIFHHGRHARSQMPIFRESMNLEEQREQLRVATHPEHLLNYDFIDLECSGRCLCTLLIITGYECRRDNANSGQDTQALEFQEHWCWTIDNSPAMQICPVHLKEPATPEQLLLDTRVNRLFQKGNDPVNRIIDGKCPRCRGLRCTTENGSQRLVYNQSCKSMWPKTIIYPYEYLPQTDHNGTVLRDIPGWLHTNNSLKPGMKFHYDWLISIYPSLSLDDVWVPYFDGKPMRDRLIHLLDTSAQAKESKDMRQINDKDVVDHSELFGVSAFGLKLWLNSANAVGAPPALVQKRDRCLRTFRNNAFTNSSYFQDLLFRCLDSNIDGLQREALTSNGLIKAESWP